MVVAIGYNIMQVLLGDNKIIDQSYQFLQSLCDYDNNTLCAM